MRSQAAFFAQVAALLVPFGCVAGCRKSLARQLRDCGHVEMLNTQVTIGDGCFSNVKWTNS